MILAKDTLHIGYGHTSHGSQITDGMYSLDAFKGGSGLYGVSDDGAAGTLHLHEGDGYGSGDLDHDAGYFPAWVNETREFLGSADENGRGSAHPDFNVIMWSWCGQLSGYTPEQVDAAYLSPMAELEGDYPGVTFVYMTGHADGTGLTGTLHLNNERIRDFCRDHGKWLYDFNDIENWDPDGEYYGDKNVDDACNYSSGEISGNWAREWQDAHPGEWYSCSSAHSEPLNANLKAYAAWRLFCAIAKARSQ